MRKQFVTGLIVFTAALAGAGIGEHLFHPSLVNAQGAPAPKEVRAEKFLLVNPAGTELGELSVDSDGRPNLKLFGTDGRVIWAARGATIRPLSER